MQLFQLLSTLLWVTTFGHAIPTPGGGPSDGSTTTKDANYAAWDNIKKDMQPGTTYVFTAMSPLTQAAKIDGDKDLQDVRNAIGGDHAYLITVQITSTVTGPKNKKVTTLKADARFWDMYVKTGGNNVEMHEYSSWSTATAGSKGITDYKFEKTLKTTFGKINTASKAWKAAHPTYDAKTNNCHTYVLAMRDAA